MSKEGRLARGKLYYEAGKFLKNIQVKEYLDSIKKVEEKPIEEKPKEVKKNGK